MLPSPERIPEAAHKSLFTAFILAALAALAIWAIFWGERTLQRPPARPPLAHSQTAAPAPAFAGASPKRLFLTKLDSAEAARRGLAPRGVRSIIGTGKKLGFGEWKWDEAGVPPGATTVRVDLGRQLVSVFRGPDEIGTAVVVYGIDGKETPRGRLPILGKTRDYHSITYDAPMPFSLWLRKDGVALHGSSVAMGKATNGCIGVPVGFAEKLFGVAEKGDIVEVIG